MYIGTDGRKYDSRYQAFGYEPSAHEVAQMRKEQLRTQRSQQRQDAKTQRLANQHRQQDLDDKKRNSFYQGAQQFAAIHDGNSQQGLGLPRNRKPTGQQASQQAGNPATKTSYEIDSNLVQDAGNLNRMLAKFSQGDEQASGQLVNFFNQHPMIGVDNAAGVNMDDQGNVQVLDDGEQVIKQFNVRALSNLNNYAVKKEQTFDPGNQVKDIEKLHETALSVSEQQALAEVAELKGAQKEKEFAKAQQHYYQAYMNKYGQRESGYRTTAVTQPYRSEGFGLFGKQQPEGAGDWRDELARKLGGGNGQEAPPAPNGAKPTPKPKPKPKAIMGRPTPPPAGKYYPHQAYGR